MLHICKMLLQETEANGCASHHKRDGKDAQ